MYKFFSVLFIFVILFATLSYSQNARYVDKKSHKVSREAMRGDNSSSFYTDFKNRQIQVNRMNKKTTSLPMDLIVENYDWMWNSYAPTLAVTYDFTGDGIGDPFMIATGNQILSTAARGRYAVVGFADELGASTYFPYGINGSGDPIRTGWNSHVVLDEANGKAYLAIYDFLASDGNIRDYLWQVDLLTDPTVATQLGDQTTALQGGWARFALDGNGLFWEGVDNVDGVPLDLAVSTDGGVNFTVVSSVGTGDPTYWGGDGNDPYPSANGNKISIITTATKGGSLNGLGLAAPTPDTTPDSASGVYHWYSKDGGNSWSGEWIHKEGDPTIVNRPNYEPRFVNWDVAGYYVDPTEITHYVRSGANSLGLIGTDTINVYPLIYWNDRDKKLMSLEIPAVETAAYDNNLAAANFWGPNGPTVKTDKSGKVVVVFWDRPQFSGDPGNSPINTYSVVGGTDTWYYDVMYAYSQDGGVTFSAPMVATSVTNEANYWAVIAGVELNATSDTATASYVYYYDEFPGSAQVGAINPIGTNCTWKYNKVSFPVNLVTSTVDVEFQVDMGVQVYKGLFNPATDAVKLAGNFNGWNNGADVMTDVDGDTIYTITKSLNPGDTLYFKFIKAADGWENDPNRQYVVPATNSVYSAWFNNDSSYQILTPVQVTFACNMEFEIVSGRFNPAADTLSARGSFNGWSSAWAMAPSVGDPNVYEVTQTINTFEGEAHNYKYAYIHGPSTSWENDPNKVYTVSASDISNGFAYVLRTYNDATLETVTNQPCTIKFTVDVSNAISAINLQPLAPVTDVRLCGANAPLMWPAGGWPNADSAFVLKCYDDGSHGDVTAGDQIWSLDVTFPQYSPLHIQYKYGANWALPTNQGGNDNENGVGADHFITLTPTLTNGTVANIFGVMGEHTLVGILRELSGLPTSYDLAQNFPNPFNPSTSIRFSIPEAGLVTVKIFNLLGEEVTTLINEYKNVGNYEVKFDASRLTSGLYIYSISSGNFSSSKKMMLMK